MSLRPVLAATFAVLALLAGAPGASAAGRVEHTVTAFTLERDGVVERDERVETWVSARRAKVVYTDGATGELLGSCAASRRTIRCFDRDPRLELAASGDGTMFLPTWAEAGRSVRRALARRWLVQTGEAVHRSTPVRRLVATEDASGDAGDTNILADRLTLMPLFRRTSDGSVVSTEDVLMRERMRASQVDFALRPPEGRRVSGTRIPR